jgi:hypothetical protein
MATEIGGAEAPACKMSKLHAKPPVARKYLNYPDLLPRQCQIEPGSLRRALSNSVQI